METLKPSEVWDKHPPTPISKRRGTGAMADRAAAANAAKADAGDAIKAVADAAAYARGGAVGADIAEDSLPARTPETWLPAHVLRPAAAATVKAQVPPRAHRAPPHATHRLQSPGQGRLAPPKHTHARTVWKASVWGAWASQ